MTLRRRTRALSNLFRRRRFERGLGDELQATLAELIAEKIATGVDPAEARRLATIELGGVEQVKEAVRDARAGVRLEQLAGDFRFGWRALSRARGFAAVSVLTLAFGIGGTTAIFSIVRAVLKGPAYPDAERLVHLSGFWPGGAGNFAYPDFLAMVEQNRSFAELAAYEAWGGVALSGSERPVMLNPSFVTASYFDLVGAQPLLGRLFNEDENRTTVASPVAVLSFACWQRQFGGEASAIGKAIRLNGSTYSVVGVLRSEFRDLGLAESGPPPDVWLPAAAAPALLGQPPLTESYRIYFGIARLRPGVTLEQARQNLAEAAARRTRENPATLAGAGLTAIPMRARTTGPVRQPALLLLTGAALILVLGCVNLANASLVRLGRRRAEMAVRSALGASSARLMQQLLVEAGVIALLGGVAGIGLAVMLTRLLGSWVRDNVAALVDPRVDGVVLLCAGLLAVGTMALVGLVPALVGRRVDLRTALGRAAAKGASAGAGDGGVRLRRGLVVVEVALATVLLVGAGLMVRSVARLVGLGLGYDTSNLLTFRVDLSGDRYAGRPERARFVQAFDERMRVIPGVVSTTVWGPSMLANATWVLSIFPRDRDPAAPTDFVQVFRHSVNPHALANLGIPLRAGREIDGRDGADSARVAVISETVARQLWPGEDAVGRSFRFPDPTRPPVTVIGVAGDAQHRNRYSLDDVAAGIGPCGVGAQRDVYVPYAQGPNPSFTAALRISGEPGAMAAAVRRAVATLDPDLPISDVAMLDDRLAGQESAPTALAILFAGFAAFAIFLAGLGIYGVIAQSVEQRAREIGIRLALGARTQDILRGVVGGGTALALIGVGIGAVGAAVLARFMAGLLFGVEASDPLTFAVVAGALLATAVATSYSPARRVLKAGALEALRQE